MKYRSKTNFLKKQNITNKKNLRKENQNKIKTTKLFNSSNSDAYKLILKTRLKHTMVLKKNPSKKAEKKQSSAPSSHLIFFL